MSPRKRGQQSLTRERVIAAALRIVDEEGPAGLTMRRLGAVLGVDASTIYYYVPNKSALEDLVVDAVMNEVDLDADDPGSPTFARVMRLIDALADALLRHPLAISFFASRSLTTPASLRPVEHLLGILHDGGFDPPYAVVTVNSIFFYVLGATSARAAGLLDAQHQRKAVAALLELPAKEFPHLTAAVSGAALIEKSEEFDLGARALVTGLLGQVRQPEGGKNGS